MQAKKLKNGSWQVRYRDLEKVQRAKNFKLKKQADDFIISLQHALKSGTYIDLKKSEAPLEEFWENFISLKSGRKPSTRYDYQSIWKVHLGPKWGKTQVGLIRLDKFDRWILGLNLSARRTNKIHLVASMILDQAVREGNLRSNPLKDVTGKREKGNLPRPSKKESGQAHTLEELLRVAKCAGEYEDFILFLGLCGVRWGEFAALQVQDLNLEKGTIHVHQSVAEIDGVLEWSDSTKTHEDRTIYLIDFLRERAPNWIEGKSPLDPLFSSPEGKVLRNSNFTRRVYQPAMIAAGVLRKRIHDLRWTMISISASEGIERHITRLQAGHSKDYMTSAYTRVYEKDRHEALEKLNSAVYQVHEKCTIGIFNGLDEVENFANSLQLSVDKAGSDDLTNSRPTDYEFGALTN